VAAAARWGSFDLADLAVATRLTGPTLVAGPSVMRVAMAGAALAAVVDEARVDGWHARTWGERGAAAIATTALVPLFAAGGGVGPLGTSPLVWAVVPAVVTAMVVLGPALARHLPAWAPTSLAAAALALTGVAG
jgi:hypothetical protein